VVSSEPGDNTVTFAQEILVADLGSGYLLNGEAEFSVSTDSRSRHDTHVILGELPVFDFRDRKASTRSANDVREFVKWTRITERAHVLSLSRSFRGEFPPCPKLVDRQWPPMHCLLLAATTRSSATGLDQLDDLTKLESPTIHEACYRVRRRSLACDGDHEVLR
jgi:hypothetical protein